MNGCDGFSVRLWGRDLAARVPVRAPGVVVRVRKMAWAAVGGPESAELEVSAWPGPLAWSCGPEPGQAGAQGQARGLGVALAQCAGWLRCPVEITDSAGDLVWWGFVDDVVIGERGGMPAALGVGLDSMVNCVQVSYPVSLDAVNGSGARAQTAWASDAESVTEYGARMLRIALSEAVAKGGALAARDTYLALAKWPTPRADFNSPSLYRTLAWPCPQGASGFGPGSGQTAKVHCSGWWSALGWQYYLDLVGREENLSGQYVWELGAGAGPLAMAQKVLLPAGVPNWQAWRVAVPLVKVGAPADGVIISLHVDAAGVPGVQLASAAVAPATGPMVWMEATLSAGVTLSATTPVWLKIARSGGANDPATFFQTVIDPMRRYVRGGARRWDGVIWDKIDPDCTMAFQLWTDTATSDQLATMLDVGQFVAGVTVTEGTLINVCRYRDGSQLLSDEIRELLLTGDNLGRRWSVVLGPDRVATVGPQRDASETLRMGCEGVLYGPHAERIGRWADVSGWWVEILGAEWWAEVGHVGRASPVFIERCEVDLETGRRKLTPRTPGKPTEDVLSAVHRGRGEVWAMSGSGGAW